MAARKLPPIFFYKLKKDGKWRHICQNCVIMVTKPPLCYSVNHVLELDSYLCSVKLADKNFYSWFGNIQFNSTTITTTTHTHTQSHTYITFKHIYTGSRSFSMEKSNNSIQFTIYVWIQTTFFFSFFRGFSIFYLN